MTQDTNVPDTTHPDSTNSTPKFTSEEFATFLKKKGFIYPSSAIYGGLAGLYDYGHLGTKVKHNFQNLWRKYFLSLNQNFYEIETSNIAAEGVFKASGHLENFTDPVAISEDGHFERADHLLEKELGQRFEGLTNQEMMDLIKKHNIKCPKTGTNIVEVKHVNMMFPVSLGVGKSHTAYLRPETAQSPFINFKTQFEIQRKKLPMGLAIIGRAYRNEISPRNLTLRQREFTQAELQIFFNPEKIQQHENWDDIEYYELNTVLVEDRKTNKITKRTAKDLLALGLPKFYVYHLAIIQKFYLEVLKINPEKFRLYQLNDKEKAFYNRFHFDLETDLTAHGWTEVGGLHYRTDHDLKGHQNISKEKMEVMDESTQSKCLPHVLELSFGVDRNVFTILDHAYQNEKDRGNIVMQLKQNITPFTAAVFPLVKNKEPIVNKAKEVLKILKDANISSFYDKASSIGKRYARADEIGIKWGITIDFDSLDDNCITIRNRDTTEQERIKITELLSFLKQ
ncbi:glycine--tRNA ligase [archaeon]|jgi:glycyl-tRNA synthetase|nr:glycine--tRNA ligase [archaeon]MBT6761463.1 glycine--tRNA ligase [archaeon]